MKRLIGCLLSVMMTVGSLAEVDKTVPYSAELAKKAEAGEEKAQMDLAMCYRKGLGIKRDDAKAFTLWQKASAQGNQDAEFRVAISYLQGEGVERDEKISFYKFLALADKGYGKAQFAVGNAYMGGLGVKKDEIKAFDWYKKAAENNEPNAQNRLGKAYRDGAGVLKDEVEAAKWFIRSAEQGNAYGQFLIGNCYAHGRGVEKNGQKAIEYLKKADEQGYLDATYNLGCFAKNGLTGVKNDKEAVKYYLKCAEKNDFESADQVGSAYLFGEGVDRDYEKAFLWFTKAANAGNANGQFHLGYMFANGLGTQKNPNKAKEWYQKAAKGNCGNAQYALGNLYYSENKFTKAKSLYEKAKKSKVILASEALLMAKKNISQESLFRGYSNLKWLGVLILIVTLLSYLSGWIFVFGVFENTNQAKVIAFILGVFGIFNLFIAPLIFIKMLKVFENPRVLIFNGLPVALFLSGWLNAFSKKQIFKRLSYLFFLVGGFCLSVLIAILLNSIGNIYLDVFHGPSLFQCFFLTAVFSFGVLGMVRIGKKEESIQTWKNLCTGAFISGFVCALSAAFFLNEYYLSAESSKTDKLVYFLIHVLLPTGLVISWKHLNPKVRKASYFLCCIWIALISLRILQLVSVERCANNYLESLTLIQKGEDLSKDRNIQKAKVAFQSASEIITNIAKQKPDWETELVKYRIDDLNKKIMAIDSQSYTNPRQNP